MVVAGVVGEVEAAFLDGDVGDGFLAAGVLELLVFGEDSGLVAAVVVVGETEEDDAENGDGILGGLEVGVGAEVVGGAPEVGFEILELGFGHGFNPDCENPAFRWAAKK